MASAKPPTMLGGTAIKPVERHGMEKFRYFLHNPDTGEIMTRTPMSWLLITVFYLIYYSCLAAFWAICMVIFLQTVPDNEPKWQTDNGLIGKSPGVGMRPKNSLDHIDSSMVMFNTESDKERTKEEKLKNKVPSYQEWTGRIEKFLENYENQTLNNATYHRIECNAENATTPQHGCQFDVVPMKDFCGSQFGYDTGSPCIFLKLNKIFGLQNEAITKTNNSYPKGMSEDLKTHIKVQTNKEQVWVDCQGKYPADKEILKGAVTYSPASKGFPNFYFPYLGQPDYLSPLVAVKFSPPKTAIGRLIHVECRAWAKNIGYSRRDKVGIAVFELYIMNKETTNLYNKEK